MKIVEISIISEDKLLLIIMVIYFIGLNDNFNFNQTGEILRGFALESNNVTTFLIQTDDLSLNYVSEQSKLVWKRNEALGYISEFKFFDISETIDTK